MAENTKIEWCHHTMNPWRGCTKIADGCTNCYADTLSKRNPSVLGIWGPNGTRVKAADAHWKLPVKWNREAECNCGAAGRGDRECAFCAGGCQRPRVFCASLADIFEDWSGDYVRESHGCILFRCHKCQTDSAGNYCGKCGNECGATYLSLDDLRRDLFALIDATPYLDWLLLTKRPENICSMWPFEAHRTGSTVSTIVYRPNVWLLTSIATQADADKNIPELLKCRDLVPVLGVSAEPLVGPVNLGPWMAEPTPDSYRLLSKFYGADGFDESGSQPERAFKLLDPQPLDWIIVGGESGHGARPCSIAWVRSIIEQCKAAGVPIFCKQLGASPVWEPTEFHADIEGGLLNLKDKKGGDWNEWAADLRVRDFPKVGVA